MGLEYKIRFPRGQTPDWNAIRASLGCVGESATLRMIDGLPALPDEIPDTNWRELRVGVSGGMITVRRLADSLSVIVWTNADARLLESRDRVAWACAAAGSGVVETDGGSLVADEFARAKGLSSA